MDDAALARLKEVLAQHARAQGVNPRDHGVVAIADLRALLAAYDQAAPVLAAAEALVPIRAQYRAILDGEYGGMAIMQYNRDAEVAWDTVVAAVEVWRVAREERAQQLTVDLWRGYEYP